MPMNSAAVKITNTRVLATAALCGLAGSLSASDYPRIKSVGVPPGATYSEAHRVSDDGTMVAVTGSAKAWRWRGPGEWDHIPFPPPPPGLIYWDAFAGLSGDGSVVFGVAYRSGGVNDYVAFRWTADDGTHQIGPDWTLIGGSSFDASVMAGDGPFASRRQVLRWTEAGGIQFLGQPPGAEFSHATGISSDGAVIALVADYGTVWSTPWLWTEAAGMQPIPMPTGYEWCVPFGLTPDGTIVVMECAGTMPPSHVFRWNQQTGLVQVPQLAPPRPRIDITGVNTDATVFVGNVSWTPVIWVNDQPQELSAYLQSRGVNLNGWELVRVTHMNPSATAMVGWGSFRNQWQGWIAYLSGCYANCDGGTVEPALNVEDFICFISRYAEATTLPHADQLVHYANCDHSTAAPVLNVDDFICFVNRFIEGCE
jgi:uncharacterized membrane protein